MELGNTIKNLRTQRNITQERFAQDIGVSVQTIFRWENDVNAPDLSMLPILASYFKVTTDFLLGVKGEASMAKLIKTVETFEVTTKAEAERMVNDFKNASFPKLTGSSILEKDGKTILEVTKEFGVELDSMKFDK